MTDEEFESPDVVNASALDVISCGLGAAVLLFLVLSIVRVAPAANLRVDEFLAVHIQVTDAPNALVTPVLHPPGGVDPIVFPLVAIDPDLGTMQLSPDLSAAIVDDVNTLTQASPSYKLIGLSPRGGPKLIDEGRRLREFVLIVRAPKPGQWKISARFFGVQEGSPPPRSTDTIEVKVTANTRYAANEKVQKISYGDVIDPFEITVAPPK